ncbi:MAG: hypothetical protein QXK94_02635 [Candidatus Jordarchaeales archaeon]
MQKSVRKGERLTRLALILVGIVVALIGGYLIYYGLTQWLDFQRGVYFSYGVLVFILLIYVFLALPRERKLQFGTKTISVLRCNNCGAYIVREFEIGDYVFKKEGECNKCNAGNYFIESIFETPLRKAKERGKDRR